MTEQSADKRTYRLVILRRFAQLAKAFFLYGTRHETRVFVVLLLILSAVVGLAQLLVSYAGRNFITSLNERDTVGLLPEPLDLSRHFRVRRFPSGSSIATAPSASRSCGGSG